MMLRRLGDSIRRQDWFTVVLEVVIVVLGVFIGLQVSNWNDGRLADEREDLLLAELRAEALRNGTAARSVGEGLTVGADAARRILARHDSGAFACAPDCWSVVVDLMHASQWQQIYSRWTTYEELRRAGLPSDRSIIDAVEAYQMATHRSTQALQTQPAYRTLVRRRIPIAVQDIYWQQCFYQDGSFEVYVDPCPAPSDLPPLDGSALQAIVSDTELMATLREWTSVARLAGTGLTSLQQELIADVVASIDGTAADQ